MVAQNGDAFLVHVAEEFRTIGFAVEHQCEPVLARIVPHTLLQFSGSGRVDFQPGHQIAAQRRQQSRVHFFVDKYEGLPVHGAEPGEQLIQ